MESAGGMIPQEHLQGMMSKQGASAINQRGSHRAAADHQYLLFAAAQVAGQWRLPRAADGKGSYSWFRSPDCVIGRPDESHRVGEREVRGEIAPHSPQESSRQCGDVRRLAQRPRDHANSPF
jgi:hypothetical protein